MDVKKIKKKDKAAELIRNNEDIFKCPVCGSDMHLNDSYSLVCSLNHSYDIARTGYINLLTESNRAVYSKELFEARRKVCSQGLFDPLIEQLAMIVEEYVDSISGKKELAIIDAGCGEGSHLYNIYEKIKELREAVGIDKSYPNQKVTDYFTNKMEIVQSQNVSYKFNIDEEVLPNLINMTPLTWSKDIKSEIISHQIDIEAITVDLTILVGRIK